MSKLPDPIRSLSGRIRALEERVRKLTNASPFNNSGLAVIDTGQTATDGSVVIPDNGLLLVDGGDVVMLDEAPSAQELFRLGKMINGDRGFLINRQDGSVALSLRATFEGGPQQITIFDANGARIAGQSSLSPAGFDVPHQAMPFIPVDYTSNATAQTTSSATFVPTHEYRGFRQNPALKPQFMVQCSDATTAAEIQVWNVINGVYLGGFAGSPATHTITVPVGTTTFALFEFASPLLIPGAMSAALHFQIHARVTAGAGSVSVAPVRTIGSGF